MISRKIGKTAGLAIFGVALALTASLPAQANDKSDKAMMKAAQDMLDAWHRIDLDGIVNMFTEDGVLHSVMKEPVKGRAALKAYMAPLIGGLTRIDLNVKNAVVKGNLVFLERVDDFDFNGKHGAVPVVGVMEIENGKVKEWREYYDHATLAKALAPDPAPAKN